MSSSHDSRVASCRMVLCRLCSPACRVKSNSATSIWKPLSVRRLTLYLSVGDRCPTKSARTPTAKKYSYSRVTFPCTETRIAAPPVLNRRRNALHRISQLSFELSQVQCRPRQTCQWRGALRVKLLVPSSDEQRTVTHRAFLRRAPALVLHAQRGAKEGVRRRATSKPSVYK